MGRRKIAPQVLKSFNMLRYQILFLLGSVSAAPQSYVSFSGYPFGSYGYSYGNNLYRYAKPASTRLANLPQPSTRLANLQQPSTALARGSNDIDDVSSPSAAAALAYLKEVSGKDGLCGIPTEVFLEQILAGKSREVANAEAQRVYLEAYNRGERLPAGGPCEKADMAWRQAVVNGKDPVLESALAFINNWPGVIEGNPCAVSGVEYVKAIVDGKSPLEANTLSAASFAKSFKKLAEAGKPLKDKACLAATKAFANAIPASSIPDPANANAFLAFADKIFNGNAPAYDPVCGVATLAYWDAYIEKKSETAANEAAAVAYLEALDKNPDFDQSSACGKAADAYIREFQG